MLINLLLSISFYVNSFFFNYTATTEIYTYGHTLSLHDALPISAAETSDLINCLGGISVKFHDYAELLTHPQIAHVDPFVMVGDARQVGTPFRSEEHTSELQSLMRISYAVFCLKK